jgi:PAS domain S-box-containing protein
VLAVAVTLLAATLRWALGPLLGDTPLPMATFYAAVAVAAWIGGFGPAVLSMVLSAALALSLFIPHSGPAWQYATTHLWALGFFFFNGTVVALVSSAHRRAERKALHSARVATQREHYLDRVLQHMNDGFVVLDQQWRFVYANDRAVALSGQAREQLLGKVLWDLYPQQPGSPGYAALHRAMDQRTPQHIEELVPGTSTWVAVHAYPSPEGLILYAADITEHKRAGAAAIDLQYRNRAILEAALDGIITIDQRGTIESYNPAAQRLFGYGPDELLGKNVRMLMPDPYQSEHDEYLSSYLRTGQRKIIGIGREVVGLRKDGSIFPMDLSVSELQIGGRRIFMGLVHDISERKEAEQQRERLLARERSARTEAEHASRMKDEFLATLSHELRTPLNAILGWTQLLRVPNPTPDDLSQGLETIERNARAQATLIEDLLDMSRIISGKLRLEVKELDLATVIDAALETVQPAAEARGIELARSYSDSITVRGDPARLQQVVWNLLSNAIKFTPRAGRVSVALSAAADGSAVELTVSDTGIGIKPEFASHVFERFRQGDASTTRSHGGLGLGLAIVRHLVELHGGTVAAHSEGPDRGATFTVTLPALVREEPRVQVSRAVAPETSLVNNADTDGSLCPDLSGLRILVVDDQADACEIVGRLLQQCNASVIVAASAEEAMRQINADPPDLIVSDIAMPGEDGYSLIRRIRKLPLDRGGAVPAVALTAYARNEDRTRALLAGYQSHLAKPVVPMELIANIAALTQRTRAADSAVDSVKPQSSAH